MALRKPEKVLGHRWPPAVAAINDHDFTLISDHRLLDESHSVAQISIGRVTSCIGGGTSSRLQKSSCDASTSTGDGYSQPAASTRGGPLGSIHRLSLLAPNSHRHRAAQHTPQ